MKFKFDAKQEYQLNAIEAVADLFDGQPLIEPDVDIKLGANLAAVSNRLDLSDDELTDNLRTVQARHGLPQDDELHTLEKSIQTAEGETDGRFLNFAVEMETGTGKTYVYLRTALDLHQRYGMRKFIIVVPSVAIREGVIKTLEMTQEHFADLYDNPPVRFYEYDSDNLTRVRQFALSQGVEFMVTTIDSFNKKEINVMRRSTDRLQGETPIHLIQQARPVLILDEPQNMKSEKSIRALAALNPLMALRYSATHANTYNLVYKLSPYDAYKKGLVKHVEVASILKADDFNQAYMQLESIRSNKNTIKARLAVHKLMANGTVKEKTLTVKPGDALEEKTGRPEYAPFVIDEINPAYDSILFANGTELSVGDSHGADKDALFKQQIRYTIEEHFRKQEKLREQGLKVLSLFFIDRVANYRDDEGNDGLIRRFFDEAFNDLKEKKKYADQWREYEPEDVQAAYFAKARKTKLNGKYIYQDTKTGGSQKDETAYNLIMKEKEKLLSFEEPTSFIFSHSALREGWDNPNVFQICTLNQSVSEMRKRQEIGRGVRIPVNQVGERVFDERANVLTVVANESYEDYVATYQQELDEEEGDSDEKAPKPKDARKRKKVELRKRYTVDNDFKELWERIKHKTRYAVNIDTKKLIEEVCQRINQQTFAPVRITAEKARVTVQDDDTLGTQRLSGTKTVTEVKGQRPLPNIVDMMMHLLEHTNPPVRLSRSTLLRIFRECEKKQEAMQNPQDFASKTVRMIREVLADELVEGIQYEKLNQWYEMTQFTAELESWEDNLVKADRSLYDHVIYDSETERRFVEDLEARDDVKLYVKLPAWFTVPTPIGSYNPDWALVFEERNAHGEETGQKLYLVRETKSTHNLDDLRPDERRKIACGKKHFNDALGTDYKVVVSADELP